jgi:hypothetical protein
MSASTVHVKQESVAKKSSQIEVKGEKERISSKKTVIFKVLI